jgi:hypothetical protein
MNQADDELFGGLGDERLLPGLESNRALVFLAWTMLREQARPVL